MFLKKDEVYALEGRHLTPKESLILHCAQNRMNTLAPNGEERSQQFMQECRLYARALAITYPNADDYLMFHVLLVSTPPEKPRKFFDFPRKHSVRTFIAEAYNQQSTK